MKEFFFLFIVLVTGIGAQAAEIYRFEERPVSGIGGYSIKVAMDPGYVLRLDADDIQGAEVASVDRQTPVRLIVTGLPSEATTHTLTIHGYTSADPTSETTFELGRFMTRDIIEIMLPNATPGRVTEFRTIMIGVFLRHLEPAAAQALIDDFKATLLNWYIEGQRQEIERRKADNQKQIEDEAINNGLLEP